MIYHPPYLHAENCRLKPPKGSKAAEREELAAREFAARDRKKRKRRGGEEGEEEVVGYGGGGGCLGGSAMTDLLDGGSGGDLKKKPLSKEDRKRMREEKLEALAEEIRLKSKKMRRERKERTRKIREEEEDGDFLSGPTLELPPNGYHGDEVTTARVIEDEKKRRRRDEKIDALPKTTTTTAAVLDEDSLISLPDDDRSSSSDDDDDDDDECDDKDLDDLKSEYAAALSRIFPSELRVTYTPVTECELYHSEELPDQTLWGGPPSARSEEDRRLGVRGLLAKYHSSEALLGMSTTRFSQEELVERILKESYGPEGSHFSGFVTITGGRQRNGKSLVEDSFGMCHQRVKVEKEQLGGFTRLQALKQCNYDREAADRLLTKITSNPCTLSRKSFHEKGETISLPFLAFLIREKGLTDFRIRHFLWYSFRPGLRGYIEGLLQRRHELKRQKAKPLLQDTLKLLANGYYGFCSASSTNYAKTRVVKESYLSKMSWNHPLSLNGGEVYRVNPLGVVRSKAQLERGGGKGGKTLRESDADIVYSIMSHAPRAKINNILQVSSAILSASRLIFFEKISLMLRVFRENCFEGSYIDTDSYLASVSHLPLSSLLKPEYEDQWEEIESFLFEKDSPVHQTSKLKIEGVFETGLFR